MGNKKIRKKLTMAGFKGLKVKAKAKSGRGAKSDPTFVVDTVHGSWEELEEALGRLSADDKQAMKDHFNGLIADEDDLGDALFGTADEFKSRLSYLEGDALKTFC